MIGIIAFIIALAGAWTLAYLGVGIVGWSLGILGFFAAAWLVGAIGWLGFMVAFVLFTPILAGLGTPGFRRQLLSARLFDWFKVVLPPMSETEREALEAGSPWWEAEMFSGAPDWQYLLNFQITKLTDEEQAFLDNETEKLCDMADEWQISHELKDMPPEVWRYLRENKFFAMLIPKEHGGLGFSSVAQSTVVAKIATGSLTVATTVMVPNSLGPGELLIRYGTPEQQKRWLPGLADGSEIPCFGLTGPEVGSDAGALPDRGIVCEGDYHGEHVLGMQLTFSKRWITLAPVATVIGLAFRLYDPDGLLGDANKTDYGITCALIAANEPGVTVGERHYPGAFMNGPVEGKDVFVPLDAIIGGRDKAGGGWRMLTECLSAGRGISLPALASAASKNAYRMTGAFARIRRQFKLPIGKFEGVQEKTARISGYNYKIEAARLLTASAVDHCTPAVATAMTKYHLTEWMRTAINDCMDVHGGRAVQRGPRNYVLPSYEAIPIGITVEGANILTRSLMIFGQGAIRCHPFVVKEMEAAARDDLNEFDTLLFSHLRHSVARGVRALTHGLTNAWSAHSPVDGVAAPYYRQLTRFSAALAICSDITLGTLGGGLKKKEMLSGRLGDVLSELYFGSATLKFFHDEGALEDDVDHLHYVMADCLHNIEQAFDGFLRNFPVKGLGVMMRIMTMPTGQHHHGPSDRLKNKLGTAIMEPSAFRDRLTAQTYIGHGEHHPTVRMEKAFNKLVEVEPIYDKFTRAIADGAVSGWNLSERLDSAVSKGILTETEAQSVREYDTLRFDAVLTDAFKSAYLSDPQNHGHIDTRTESRVA